MFLSWHTSRTHNSSQGCRRLFHWRVTRCRDLKLPLTEATKGSWAPVVATSSKGRMGAPVAKAMVQNGEENDSNDGKPILFNSF